MGCAKLQNDESWRRLPSPLKNIGRQLLATSSEFEGLTREALRAQKSASTIENDSGTVEIQELRIGELSIVSGKTTPMTALMGDDKNIVVNVCYAGVITHQAGRTKTIAKSNELLITPNDGGIMSMGYLAGNAFSLDGARLRRTVQALTGPSDAIEFDQPFASSAGEREKGNYRAKALFAVFEQIDLLLLEDQLLPTALCLDDQIYRLLALEFIARHQLLGRVLGREKARASRPSAFSDLVDYIGSHSHLNLSLTDLEAQSNYSGRHLQNLFKEKFDCTPMQFVRRKRLSAAMERLQIAEADDTVTRIARDCGYRYTSNFTTDFQREFGVNPSVVLRSSR